MSYVFSPASCLIPLATLSMPFLKALNVISLTLFFLEIYFKKNVDCYTQISEKLQEVEYGSNVIWVRQIYSLY